MFTAVVILLSKYFSRAKEKRNKEKIEINIDGIKVNKEKKAIYFLLALDPLTLIFDLKAFFISRNIKTKKINNKTMFNPSNVCRFVWFNYIKLLLINVKNVKNPIDSVIIKITDMKIFFLIKSNIMQ